MVTFKEINISDKELFDSYTSCVKISFYNFSNIYMWRKAMNYRYAIIDGSLCIFAKYRDSNPFMFFPLGSHDIESTMLEVTEQIGFPITLRPLSQRMADQITSIYPDLVPEFRRGLCDYIYNTSDLATLSGKKLHKKRNHLNKFTKTYSYDYITVTSENLDILKNAVDHLYTDEDKLDPDFVDEYYAINELVNNFGTLGLKAGVITIDGNFAAYSIGELQSSDIALIHTEKADRNYDGAYSAINYEFIRHEFADTKFVNREEDMGIEGLRQAKTSYNPIAFNNVYSITFKTKEDLNYVKSCNVKQMACSCRGICK
jgi:Uncharacterized conserved protein